MPRQQELLAPTIKPAEAERMAAVVRAEGARQCSILAAEAAAQQIELTGEAEGVAITAGVQAEGTGGDSASDAAARPTDRARGSRSARLDNLTVVDPSRASKLADTVVKTAAEGSAIAKSLLGVDLAQLMQRLASRNGERT